MFIHHLLRTLAQENYMQLCKIGLTMQLNASKERQHPCRMESWDILDGNLIPMYALFLRNTHMEGDYTGRFLSIIDGTMEIGILWISSSNNDDNPSHKSWGNCWEVLFINTDYMWKVLHGWTDCILERCQATYPKSDGDKCEQFMHGGGWHSHVFSHCHSWGHRRAETPYLSGNRPWFRKGRPQKHQCRSSNASDV